MKSYAFPGNIEEEILAVGATQVPYMRTREFSEINLENERILLDLIGCRGGRVIVYTASGTGAMDAIVTNYVATKHQAFIIDGGSFGHRWVQLCEYYHLPHYRYEVGFGRQIDYADLRRAVERERPDVFLCQHHETSTGQLFDLEQISGICKANGASLVVDVISSFLAEPLDMDALGIDICVTSTQKGLNVPPGLSVLFFSSRLNGYEFAHNSYYFDFEDNFKNLLRGQTPFSPATLIFLQLNARLRALRTEGGAGANIARIHERSAHFKDLCRKYGWRIAAENPSAAVTGFFVKEGTGQKIFRALIEEQNTFVMPSGTPDFLRVSHMGVQSLSDLDALAASIHEIENR